MKSRDFVTVPTAGVVLALLLSVGQVTAADLAPGPEATSGASTSQHANYHADYHADYRANGAADRAKGTEDDSTLRRDERELEADQAPGPKEDRHGGEAGRATHRTDRRQRGCAIPGQRAIGEVKFGKEGVRGGWRLHAADATESHDKKCASG